jgi:hypothetical protein
MRENHREVIGCHRIRAGKIEIITEDMILRTNALQNDFRHIESQIKKKTRYFFPF